MKPYDRPTDSLPISRRTVIMNAGLAAAAIAGLSSCTNYGSAPVTEPSAAATSGGATGGASSAAGWTDGQRCRYPGRQRQDLSRRPDRDHPAEGRRVQGVQLNLYAPELSGSHRHRHDQLRLPRQQVLDHRRFGGESSGTPATARRRRSRSTEIPSPSPEHALQLGAQAPPKAIISFRVASRRLTSACALTLHSFRASWSFLASPLSSIGWPFA